MKCLCCNKEISDNSKFCKFCGSEVLDFENIDIDKIKSKDSKAKSILCYYLQSCKANIKFWEKQILKSNDLTNNKHLIDSYNNYFNFINTNINSFELEIKIKNYNEKEFIIANKILTDFKLEAEECFNKYKIERNKNNSNVDLINKLCEFLIKLIYKINSFQEKYLNSIEQKINLEEKKEDTFIANPSEKQMYSSMSDVNKNDIKEDNMEEKKEMQEKEQISDKNIEKRIYKWKEKLIDLSKRNRLLNFKSTKTSTLRIIDEQPPEVYRALVQNSQEMEFLPININDKNVLEEEKKSIEELNEGIEFKPQEFKEYNIENLEKKHIDKYLQTKRSKDELNKVLAKISSTAKSTNDDLGYNVLFLSLGSIVWYESDISNEKMQSPLILIPVEIKRKSISDQFTIKYNEDSIILNPALVLKFKRDFGINFEEISIDENELDPIEIFTQIQNKIASKTRWKLLNNIYIGLFSFAKFVMYKDLDTNQDLIKSNTLVQTICGVNDSKQVSTNNICPMNELEKRIVPQSTFQILDADSSQQQAIQVVKQGNNLVIEGPPGTGKSQTIANIISELLAQGKKVLFVSQKIAALEVVKSRLDKNGLSPYCLELHSNKTNKKHVLQELVNTLNFNYEAYYNESNLSKLDLDIKLLKQYSNELHTPIGELNYKPFEALGIVLKNSHIPDFEYIFDSYDTWSMNKYNENKKLFTSIKEILAKLGNPMEFPMYGAEIRDIEFEEKIKLKNILKDFISDFNNFISNIKDLQNSLLFKDINKVSEVSKYLEIVDVLSHIPNSAIDNISRNDRSIEEDVQTVCNIVKNFNIYNNRLKKKYNLGILNEDIDELISKFTIYKDKFVSRISFKYYKECKFIRSFFINSYRPNLDELVSDLVNIKELKNWIEKLEECDSLASDLYDKIWDKSNPNEEEIKNKSKYLVKFKEIVNSGKYFNGDILSKLNAFGIEYDKLQNLSSSIISLEKKLKYNYTEIEKIIKLNTINVFGSDFENALFESLNSKILAIMGVLDDLDIWFRYLEVMDKIEQSNLSEFLNKCIQSNIPLDEYDVAFETQFLRVWLNGFVYRMNPSMKQFNSLEHNILVEEFKNLDKDQIDSAKVRLLQKLSFNSSRAKEEFYKETSELQRQGKLQRLKKSLRQIIKSIPNLFMSIKPCLMMSPSTVAQLLDPEIFKFDVVIFDEASQLTTEDCIGSIIRGKKLVVAGDTKQLPPTSFFKTVVEPDEDVEESDENDSSETTREDLDSILDECTTSGFPQCMLKWHYRSKHEHLIAFSNKHLYQELYTFPSCVEEAETLGIKFFYHEPVASTKENKCLEEATIVAEAIMKHAKTHPELTLGVATLNIKQKGLIEAELDKLREKDPSCESFFSTEKQEYFFVKNLESIQGDERDVIMISVGYFKNQNGILPMNFGPINKDGGERRLNVLITRARNMVQIFSGIKASDFNMDKTDKRGVQLLQWYLDFAERGEIALNQNTIYDNEDSFDSPFEESVCKGLREKGYIVKTQVGCSAYRIDLAIRDKKNPGHFILGIECDGASYHSSATARDRDRLRQEVLERLGWKIYRIWSTDWFKNPQKQLDNLVSYIENINKEMIV